MATEITKQKGGVEDLLFSLTTEIQARQEGASIEDKTITGINSSVIPYNGSFTVEQALTNIITGILGTGGGGQFLGLSPIKSVQYMAQETIDDEIIVVGGTYNSFAIDSLVIGNGGSLTVEDGAVFKIL